LKSFLEFWWIFKPIVVKLLREQNPCIKPVYSTALHRHRTIVSVELRLLDLITTGDGTSFEEAKQGAALGMLEILETSCHSRSPKEDVKISPSSYVMLKSTKKFWMEWRLQREVENLLKQLVVLKGNDFSCLGEHLSKLRQLCVDQETENQLSQFKDKLEKLPSDEMTANEIQSPLTKEALENHDKKVGKMTVIDRLGINYSKSSLKDIEKTNDDIEALTETTIDGSAHTFDTKSSNTFDQLEKEDDLPNQIELQSVHSFQTKDRNNEIEGNKSKNESTTGESDKIGSTRSNDETTEGCKTHESKKDTCSKKENPTAEPPLRWLRLNVQSGCDYEADEKNVLECLSKFGNVEALKWGGKILTWGKRLEFKNGGNSVKFSHTSTARSVVNKLFTVDGVTFHTSWRIKDIHLFNGPVPFQVLLESNHLPKTWERHIIVKKAMLQYGEVLAVDFHGGKWANKAVVSFSEEWVVQNLIGCWWKIDGTPVLAKEVSSLTL